MFRPRIIPVLLLKNQGLVKSKQFKEHRYIGDPINAVKIFNDLRADELVFLDIDASRENRTISASLIKDIGEEANMPFAVGGGIRTLQNISNIIAGGAEKVILGSVAFEDPGFVRRAADEFGSSTITVCVDVKKKFLGKEQAWIRNGKESTGISPLEFCKRMQNNGAGEIILQSIERDGMRVGYDLELIKRITNELTIPVIALGGAASLHHMKEAYIDSHASGLAAGSLFVYQGVRQGVLINYPEKSEIQTMFDLK